MTISPLHTFCIPCHLPMSVITYQMEFTFCYALRVPPLRPSNIMSNAMHTIYIEIHIVFSKVCIFLQNFQLSPFYNAPCAEGFTLRHHFWLATAITKIASVRSADFGTLGYCVHPKMDVIQGLGKGITLFR